MFNIKCSKKRYLMSGVTALAILVVMVFCILLVTERAKRAHSRKDEYLNEDDALDIPMDHLPKQLASESEPSALVSTQSVLLTTLIPSILYNEEQEQKVQNNTSIETIGTIVIPRIDIDEEEEIEELKNITLDQSQSIIEVLELSAASKGMIETPKIRTICAKQERDQIKRHRNEEHAQLLRIRENEHEFREVEHAQMFDLVQREKVSLREEHDLKMKILSEKLFYYQRLNSNGSQEIKT